MMRPLSRLCLGLVLLAGCSPSSPDPGASASAKATASAPAAKAATSKAPATAAPVAPAAKAPAAAVATLAQAGEGLIALTAEGGKLDPPVAKARIPAGAWFCDMGTVHFARSEKGDGTCPLCHMALVQQGAALAGDHGGDHAGHGHD